MDFFCEGALFMVFFRDFKWNKVETSKLLQNVQKQPLAFYYDAVYANFDLDLIFWIFFEQLSFALLDARL